eukprot:SAG31_NODE_393_length_16293_cov_15.804372_10_plen_55_part_00
MKAAVYDDFSGPITIRDVAVPVPPRGGIVVEVKATGGEEFYFLVFVGLFSFSWD